MTDHPNKGQAYRPIDSTVLLEVQLRHVRGRVNNVLARQNQSLPIRQADGTSLLQQQFIVGPDRPVVLTNIKGMLLIEASYPFTVVIGETELPCDGVFACTCEISQLTLRARSPTSINVLAVVANL